MVKKFLYAIHVLLFLSVFFPVEASQRELTIARTLQEIDQNLTNPQNNPEEIEIKIIALDEDTGFIFINAGSLEGIKEGDVLSDSQGIEVVIKEVFLNSSKAIVDKSKIQSLKEGQILRITRSSGQKKIELSGESRTFVTNYDRRGTSRNKSFYPPGANFGQEIDLQMKGNLSDELNMEAFVSGRITDDEFIDREQRSLESLYLNLEQKDKHYGLNLGDFHIYFSDYSLSQSLKGLKSFCKADNPYGELSLYAFSGTNKHRWNDLWRELDDETYTRYVSGARLEQKLKDETLKVGLNFVDNRDQRGSTSKTGNPIRNEVISSDISLKLADRLFLRSEVATAFTDTNTSPNSSVKTKNDSAYKLNTDLKVTTQDYFKSKISFLAERAGQNFSSLSGILKTDRQEYRGHFDYSIYDWFLGYLGYDRLYDNLKDGLTRTTKIEDQEIGFKLRPSQERQELEYALDLERRRRESSDTSIDERTRSIHLGARDKIGIFRTWAGWRLNIRDDDATQTNSRLGHIIDLGARTNLSLGRLDIIPHISTQFEKTKQEDSANEFKFFHLDIGSNVRFSEFTDLDLKYVISDTDNHILSQNLFRNCLEFNLRQFLDKEKKKEFNLNYKFDEFSNRNLDRDFAESILVIEYTQRF